MKFAITTEESLKAKIPHEIFLTNLIANHILWFVAALGLVKSYWQPLALVPTVSVILLGYTLWRARQSRRIDGWFVMCHWQIAAKRSGVFILMLAVLGGIGLLAWFAGPHLGMRKEAVWATVGGVCILPVMVTVLVLIIMENDVLHQATQHKLPKSILERFPNPGVAVVEE